jgi:NADPH2:quinone reductase
METAEINAVILEKFGETPVYGKKPKPVPKEGEVLVKVEASTINPSDNLFLRGLYYPKALPVTAGIEGVGRIE